MLFLTRHAAMSEPMLSVIEEREAIRRWQQEADRAALELLLRSHARLVYSQAARWTDNPSHREDLVAEGMIGLMRAADDFDLGKDVRFSTYAAWWVMNGVSAAVVRIRSVIDIPVRTYLEATGGRNEGSETVASAQQVIQGIVTLDVGDALDGSFVSDALTPEESAALRSEAAEQRRRLDEALDSMDPDDALVIRRLRLDDPTISVGEFSLQYGMSRDRVRQVEKRALLRLRKRLIDGGFQLASVM